MCLHYNHSYNKYRSAKQTSITVATVHLRHRDRGVLQILGSPRVTQEAFREFSEGEKNLRSELKMGLIANATKNVG